MKSFFLFENDTLAKIIVEPSAYPGVRRTADIIAEDLYLVTGRRTGIYTDPDDCNNENAIIIATVGNSPLLDSLESRGLIDTSSLSGKRECYMMQLIESPYAPFKQVKQALLIIGSDKRGTIYGMFTLSEMCGVSPLIFWGDAAPEKKLRIELDFDTVLISKEPSVKYRGFFINDEWPAFGNWCTDRYGDVNAKAYDVIFQLLLRLKGNYLWPAMWNSSFSEDGPGLENARLADEYGVIMGASHHEPMCRAGVEWQRIYNKYGDDNTWSFVSNSKAITEFWKDGIIRNKDFENIITIGMRGENDSHLLGENATIQDNINVLKSAITVQNKLMREHLNPDLKKVPRMFAIYKEVEDFYFGVDGCDGLLGWDELEDVILLFSEDNHGNLRAIPAVSDKMHSGGYGMYYHFDYHGGPTSYEWLNHINPVRAWEQLTMAYDYGIREMWIVNVGDIKFNEYPLSFFMNLAYDFDKWGTSNLNSAAEYTALWIDKQFGKDLRKDCKDKIHELLDFYTAWSAARIPESMNPDVFINNYHEQERIYDMVTDAVSLADNLRRSIPGQYLPAFESMIYYPFMTFFSAMLINITAAMNYTHAERGTLVANQYAAMLQNAIPKDRLYVNKFHNFLNGKWNHMMESPHMCFRTWDAHNWTYPVVKTVMPIPYPKIVVSFRGYQTYNLGHHWQDSGCICNTEMTRPDVNEIIIDIDSRGDVDYSFNLECNKPWLTFSQTHGKSFLKSVPRISITVSCDRSMLPDIDTANVELTFNFVDGSKTKAFLNVKSGNKTYTGHPGAFLETQDYICINADHFTSSADADITSGDKPGTSAGWRVVPRLGRSGNAVRLFPSVINFVNEKTRPYVEYKFIAMQSADYTAVFYLSPRNPLVKGGAMKGCYSVNDSKPVLFDIVAEDYAPVNENRDWCAAVTDNIRKIFLTTSLSQGINTLRFYAADPNVILEHIVLYPKTTPAPASYLPPPESYRIP